MRIIAGALGGRSLKTVEGPGYRPATAKVREAIFSMLSSRGVVWSGLRVLDLFAGSGSLSFEALSRGAQEVCLVEREPKVVQCLNQNVDALDVADRCRVAESDVLRFLRGRAYQPYDVIFADPPYGENRLAPTLKAIMKGDWLAPAGYLLAEIEGLLRFDAAAAHEELELEVDRVAIYPGTFDPLTNGHANIIRRGLRMFDNIIVAVAADTGKSPLFSLEERVAMAEKVFAKEPNISVEPFQGLLVEYVARRNVHTVLRGLRAVSDFEYEFQIALMNRKLRPDIETLFLISDYRWLYISSTIVKTVARLGGDVRGLVPDYVLSCLRERFGFTHGEIEPVAPPPVPELSELARLQELEASLDRDADK